MVKTFSLVGHFDPLGHAFCDSLRSLPAYQKMRLKSIARISEWDVKIGQGIPGMRNPGILGKKKWRPKWK